MSIARSIRELTEAEDQPIAEARRLERIDGSWTGTTPGRASGLYKAAYIVGERRRELVRRAAA